MGNNIETKVLVVVDMQNDFVTGALANKEAEKIISNVKAKVEEYKANNDVVIFTRDTHYDDYMSTEEGKNLPVPHCIECSDGWEIVDELKDIAENYKLKNLTYINIIDKPTFGSIDLANELDYIDSYAAITNIELVGLCTDICVISNAIIAKAAIPNAHVIVDARCCAGVTPESHDTALAAMKAIQVEVIGQGEEPWRN